MRLRVRVRVSIGVSVMVRVTVRVRSQLGKSRMETRDLTLAKPVEFCGWGIWGVWVWV